MTQSKPVIQLLKTESEKEECAKIMSESEPWITLNFDYEKVIEILNDSINEVYIMFIGSDIVGFSIVQMKGSFVGYIKTIVIKPSWRNMHLGEKMIKYLENRIFEVHPNIFLCVSSFNLKAKKFYYRLGYEFVGEISDYVVKGHAEILLRKTRGPISDFESLKV
ncbi:GNAT family N-acetyltransferase [Bacteroidota bacterium]